MLTQQNYDLNNIDKNVIYSTNVMSFQHTTFQLSLFMLLIYFNDLQQMFMFSIGKHIFIKALTKV